MDDLYKEIIIEEFQHPHNRGALADADAIINERNASCGDQVTIFLKFAGEKVQDVRWQGDGCAISMAAMSVLSEKIKGLTRAEIKKITKKDLENLLGLEEITYGREKCLLLGSAGLQHHL
jgi:nitrogen fixation NifU-like protein